MKNTKVVFVFILLFSCKTENNKNVLKQNCDLSIVPTQFDSLYLNTYLNNSFSDFLTISMDRKREYYKGKIKSIEELYFKSSKVFDEDVEKLESTYFYTFNKYGKIYSVESKNPINNSKSLQKELFKYDKNNHLVFRYSNESLNLKNKLLYHYLENGTVADIEEYSGDPDEKLDSSTLLDRTVFKYDSNQNILQEKLVQYDSYNSTMDSLAVNYTYFENKINEIFVFDKSGRKQWHIIPNYNSELNEINFNIFPLFFSFGDESLNQIITLKYDEKCSLKELISVSFVDKKQNGKRYTKLSIDEHTNPTELFTFEVATPNDNSLKYLEDPDYSKINIIESEHIEYKYDKIGNWIEKKEGDLIIRRKITYQ